MKRASIVCKSRVFINHYMGSMARKYFPNNWEEYYTAPDNLFHRHTFQEVMEWKVGGWELPSSIYCMIRETNLKTRKVKEHIYQRKGAARAKVQQLLNNPDTEFIVADHDSIHYIYPGDIHDPDELDDDYDGEYDE